MTTFGTVKEGAKKFFCLMKNDETVLLLAFQKSASKCSKALKPEAS